MMYILKIVLEILSKINEPGNIGHTDLKYYEATHCVILKQSPKYDASPSNSVGDNKQNLCTMKYWSH